jgi:hypothetical protein
MASFALLVDGAPVAATFVTGVARPDVQAVYAANGCPGMTVNVGFTFTFDAALLPPGSHQVKVRVTDDRALVTETNAQAITIVPAPGSLVWTQVGTLPPVPNSLGADAVALGGSIYATSYLNDHGCRQVTLRAYDPGSAAWGPAILPPAPVAAVKLATLGNVVYLVGRDCSDIASLQGYDVSTGTWSTYAPLPSASSLQGVVAIDGRLFAVGVGVAYAYDPSSNAWTAIAAPPTINGYNTYLGAVRAIHGLLYLAGGAGPGYSYSWATNRLVVYDPQLNTWTEKAPMRLARYSLALGTLGGKLYALGGHQGNLFSTTTAAVEAYDPALDQWTDAPSMPGTRGAFGAATVDGFLHVLGGVFRGNGNTYGAVTTIDALSLAVDPWMNIDEPASGATVGSTFTVRGWALDRDAVTGPGVDDVHLWAYPLSGSEPPRFLGNNYFGARPDVGAVFGSQFDNSGFSLSVSGLPAGPHRIVAYVWSARVGRFIQTQSVDVTVVLPVSNPAMSLDTPLDGAVVTQPFMAGGWALDLGAPSGNGVDAVHVWAFPAGGGAPVFVASSYGGGARGDVGAVYGSQFTNSGFTFEISGLPPGSYDLAVYAHSTVANAFNQARVVRITVQ